MIRFALFGASRAGRTHARNIARHPRTELAIVGASRVARFAASVNESYPGNSADPYACERQPPQG